MAHTARLVAIGIHYHNRPLARPFVFSLPQPRQRIRRALGDADTGTVHPARFPAGNPGPFHLL
jgi:hypothetical protein